MRHVVIQTSLAAVILAIAGYGTAFAQRAGGEIYAVNPYSYYDRGYGVREQRGPRVYGYRSEPGLALRTPSRPQSCGVYHYWNGERCADARVNPPTLN